jgi:hypothetical protein
MNFKQMIIVLMLFITGLWFMSLPLWIDQAIPLLSEALKEAQDIFQRLHIAIESLIIILQQ